jgi:2,3-bisphosphoglycerate-independent phosphoglycerate mutase
MKTGVELAEGLAVPRGGSILLAVLDGLGDVNVPGLNRRTPLEEAEIPNLDALAREGALGQLVPVAQGITPGSGPAHMALFGYDPVETLIGRGVLEVLGIGFPLLRGDLAARINFCTLDGDGIITDRRAGRISSGQCGELAAILDTITIPGVEVMVRPVKEHRACAVFRGDGLADGLGDTDPGAEGLAPLPVEAPSPECRRSAEVVGEFVRQALDLLRPRPRANGILLRGISVNRNYRSFASRFRLRPPQWRCTPCTAGWLRFWECPLPAGPGKPQGPGEGGPRLPGRWVRLRLSASQATDSSGEDGDWERKKAALEEFDRALPEILRAGFDVVAVTGDHSTPCAMKMHSWHPVPLLVRGGFQRAGWSGAFSERQAAAGALGTLNSLDLMPFCWLPREGWRNSVPDALVCVSGGVDSTAAMLICAGEYGSVRALFVDTRGNGPPRRP